MRRSANLILARTSDQLARVRDLPRRHLIFGKLRADILALERETEGLLSEITQGAVV